MPCDGGWCLIRPSRKDATHHHGVQTSTVESAISTLKAGSCLELGLEVGLDLEGSIGEGSAIVEALEGGIGRGDSRRKSK